MSNQVPETRQRILSASLKLLEASGGKEVRVSDIADEAGVTRQTLYLYFRNRSDLLIATTYYLDELKGADERLARSRQATSGKERLDTYVTAWGNYIPEVYGVFRALVAMNNEDANTVWALRMQDMWEGCEAAVKALKAEGQLSNDYTTREASDLLWMLLSIRNWEHLRIDKKWSQQKYTKAMIKSAHRLLLAD